MAGEDALIVALLVLGQLHVSLVLVNGADVGDAKAVDARLVARGRSSRG